MAERYPGGVISKTPPVVTGPTGGEGGSASGMWTLDTVLEYEKAGAWPKPPLPKEIYVWGWNFRGQLGDNTTTSRSSPVQVGSLTTWSEATAGDAFTVAIKSGELWSWGWGYQGRLGHGDVESRSSPVQIGALTNWSKVAAGRSHTMSIKTDGTLWGWGRNVFSLGDGTATDRSSPVQIGALTDWSQVSAGYDGTNAIKTDGTLWGWGVNSFGQIGDNTSNGKFSPVQVGALTNWYEISKGSNHTASIKTDGTLWTWGRNNSGQLGDNTSFIINKSSPVQIGALTDWSQVSCGDFHTTAIKTDGTLWAWGDNNNYGQLGDNSIIRRSSPVQVGALTNWSKVSAGATFTTAIKTDGTFWSWGRGATGRLGDGTTINKSSPVQVGSATTWFSVGRKPMAQHTVAISAS